MGLGISHAGVMVANGTDPWSGWTGDLVDTHDNDHYHAFWTLEPYNGSDDGTTSYTVVGIATGN
jgi:hypothetical protein